MGNQRSPYKMTYPSLLGLGVAMTSRGGTHWPKRGAPQAATSGPIPS